MQWPIAPTTAHELMELAQRPFIKFEIQVPDGGVWIDICDYWGLGATKKKNYLKDVSFTTAGARMMAAPIAGQFSAVIDNPGNIFHPYHPTSGAQGFFRAGRRVRISLGGHFASGDNDWQRIIGFMDEPQYSSDTLEVNITGLDYMRRLSDMKFTMEFSTYAPTPIDNYWGASKTFSTVASVAVWGGELYIENDALSAADAFTMANWTVMNNLARGAIGDVICGSVNTGWFQIIAPGVGYAEVPNIGAVTAGRRYRVVFSYRRFTASVGTLDVQIRTDGAGDTDVMGEITGLDHRTVGPATCAQASFIFTATASCNVKMRVTNNSAIALTSFRLDLMSFRELTSWDNTSYFMPAGCNGVYYAVLDGVPIWPGKQKGEGWYYNPIYNYFYFDNEKYISTGMNLVVYYFMTQQAQNVVADILVKAFPAVYGAAFPANRVAALNAMLNPVTGVGIDRSWFKAGSTYIDAIKMLCERCNYRFYFAYDGTPRFVPGPTPAAVPIFIPFLPKHFQSPIIYQDKSEIWNRILIEGEKAAELVGWEENMPSELKGETFDNASMLNYGTRTKSIKNHLFQDQASIDAPVTGMCAILLAAYKDPKWYLDFEMPYNAAPMEIGDTIQVEEFLELTLADVVHICLIRELAISLYNVTYKCEIKMPE